MINTIYVVHSDVDENNVYAEFDFAEDAIEYAKEHIADKTWVEAVELEYNDFGEVVDEFEHETIWSYADDDEEQIESEDDFTLTDLEECNKPVEEDIEITIKEIPDDDFDIEWVEVEIPEKPVCVGDECCADGSCETPSEDNVWDE